MRYQLGRGFITRVRTCQRAGDDRGQRLFGAKASGGVF